MTTEEVESCASTWGSTLSRPFVVDEVAGVIKTADVIISNLIKDNLRLRTELNKIARAANQAAE